MLKVFDFNKMPVVEVVNEILVDEINKFLSEGQGFKPKIVLVSPIEVGEGISTSSFGDQFKEDSIPRSKQFAKYYKEIADDRGCIYVDAATVAKVSPDDSLHLSVESHKALAEKIYQTILQEEGK